ncbi:MAG: uncharacterized protein QOI20_482 [Acidimicrobiaceae bacterium]|jgi:uncharacterized protein YcbX|nr:uncharacterized protein [Acidimicrobiaceae bacterium]
MHAMVARLGRYPVKSFQGETVDGAEVGMSGMAGDRRWAVVDPATGKALSAKRDRRLLEASARTTSDGEVVVTLPDGTSAAAGDQSLDRAVAAWLGRDVRVQGADADAPSAYEMNVVNTDEASPVVDIPCPPGTFFDFGAVHLLTTASLRAGAAAYPEGDWSAERFRPTVLVDAGDGAEGFLENEWVGRTVRIGDIVLQPFMPTVRCAMVTMPQTAHGLSRDLGIATTVNRHNQSSLGVYAVVAAPGRIEVGLPVVID